MRTADRILFRRIRTGRLRAANGCRPTPRQGDTRKGPAWYCGLGAFLLPASTGERASSAEPVEYPQPFAQNTLPRSSAAKLAGNAVVGMPPRSSQ